MNVGLVISSDNPCSSARRDASLFRRFHHFKVAANPPHKEQRLVFGKQGSRADVGERHGELEAVLRFVEEMAIAIGFGSDGDALRERRIHAIWPVQAVHTAYSVNGGRGTAKKLKPSPADWLIEFSPPLEQRERHQVVTKQAIHACDPSTWGDQPDSHRHKRLHGA